MKAVTFLFFAFLFNTACSQENIYNTNNKGIGVEGYDLISYFEGATAKGGKVFQSSVDGVIYYFTSKKHLDQFNTNPEKYLPQYGGWCAYAMGVDGSKVDVNPETYKIVDGKLYLFYNKLFTNTLTTWNKNEQALKQQADENWKKQKP